MAITVVAEATDDKFSEQKVSLQKLDARVATAHNRVDDDERQGFLGSVIFISVHQSFHACVLFADACALDFLGDLCHDLDVSGSDASQIVELDSDVFCRGVEAKQKEVAEAAKDESAGERLLQKCRAHISERLVELNA